MVVKPVKRKQFKLASCNAISNFINLSTSEIETNLYHNNVMHDLMGQCHEIFGTFLFDPKTPPEPHVNRKNGFANLFIIAKTFAKGQYSRRR